MKRILVPYDFSECAENALHQAIYMAKKWKAELHLLHVASLHPYWRELPAEDIQVYETNLKLALRIEAKLKEKAEEYSDESLTIQWKYTSGDVIESVVEFAHKEAIDLLVMGTHGTSGIQEWMIGSNTQKILRLVSCPVLAIKHDLVIRDFKDIAFVSDYKEDAKPAFQKTLEFARLFNATIYLVNMDEPGFFGDPLMAVRRSMRNFEEMAKDEGVECHLRRLSAGDFEEQLQKELQVDGIDLVVIPTRGKGALIRLFFVSMAEAVVNHLEKSVMTIRI